MTRARHPEEAQTRATFDRNDRAARHAEVKIAGLRAAQAVARLRPGDVIRVYLVEERIQDFSSLLAECASQRRAYHIVSKEELARVAGTEHHEGICILARAKPVPSLADALSAAEPEETWLLLDRIANPHNVGGILRTAAHFDVRNVLLAGDWPRIPPAVHRAAEGGAEHVRTLPFDPSARNLERLKAAGFAIIGTSSSAKRSLYDLDAPARTLLVFGAEDGGLSKSLIEASDELVRIPGTGFVQSLNVSCAVAVTLAEFYRHRARPKRPRSASREGPEARRVQEGASEKARGRSRVPRRGRSSSEAPPGRGARRPGPSGGR